MNLKRTLLALCAALSAACGSATVKSTGNPGDANNANNTTGPLLVAERVFTTAGRSYYLQALKSLPTDHVDRTKSLELTSADVAVFNGWVFTRDRTAKTITRYGVGADLALTKQDDLSFATTGLPGGRTYDAYLSPTQAYALDRANLKLIEWNPTTMELTGKVIDISQYGKANLAFTFYPPLKVGTKVYAQVGWTDEANRVIYPKLALMVIDGQGGVPPIIEDGRVSPGYALFSDASGNIYAPGFTSAAYKRYGTTSPAGQDFPPDGVLKFVPGASSFEASYMVNLTYAIKSPSIYAAWHVDDTHVLVQGVDPTSSTAGWTDADSVYDSDQFIFALVDVHAGTYEVISALPKGEARNSLPQIIDGKIFVQSYGDTGSTVATVDGTTVTSAFTIPSGDLWHLQRVQ